MADIEKVIKGLEHCKRESEHIDDNPCNGCPYYELKECQQMMADALELLKEQRMDIEALLGKKVYLELYVKTVKDWRNNVRYIEELYENQ